MSKIGPMVFSRRHFVGLLPAGLAGGALARNVSSVIRLRFSHFLGPDSYFQKELIEPWARQLEMRSNGRVSVTILSGADPTGDVTQQAAHVESGIVDIALGLRGAEGNRFPASSLIEVPMAVQDARQGSRALWSLYEDGTIAAEYRNFKLLALFVHNPGVIHTVRKRVVTPSDLEGLRLRVPGRAVAIALSRLGASPSILQVNDVMPAVRSGELDGVITNWGTPLPGFYQALRSHTDVPFYAAAFFIVMNKQRFASLPSPVQQAIDALSGRLLVDLIADGWNRWDGAGKVRASAGDQEIIRPAPAEMAQWRAALLPAVDQYIDELSAIHPQARLVHDKIARLAAGGHR